MQQFTPKKFNVPALKGISARNIEEHTKLYEGYVKNANAIMDLYGKNVGDPVANAYVLGELGRRFSFEYNGMRNHEVYFSSLEGCATPFNDTSALVQALAKEWGSFEAWLTSFKLLAMTRGIGWAVLWYDKTDKRLLASWVDEQHLGQLNSCEMILALDMWEHSYVADYQPSGKKNYVEDFFVNLNWKIVEDRYAKAKN